MLMAGDGSPLGSWLAYYVVIVDSYQMTGKLEECDGWSECSSLPEGMIGGGWWMVRRRPSFLCKSFPGLWEVFFDRIKMSARISCLPLINL